MKTINNIQQQQQQSKSGWADIAICKSYIKNIDL